MSLASTIHDLISNSKRVKAASYQRNWGFVSAHREVADYESRDGFSGTAEGYLAIAEVLQQLAEVFDKDDEAYHSFKVIERLVRRHICQLSALKRN